MASYTLFKIINKNDPDIFNLSFLNVFFTPFQNNINRQMKNYEKITIIMSTRKGLLQESKSCLRRKSTGRHIWNVKWSNPCAVVLFTEAEDDILQIDDRMS